MKDAFRTRLETALHGTYALERELGGGGMSRTYLAREGALSRQVVVKVLAPELLEGLSVERFQREVLTAAQLQHPHVVPVLTAGTADGLPWFTMPYVDGESLRALLQRGLPPLDQAVSILRDVARALVYAHGRGIVHRDIKPDNVLLSEGVATVTDFGIAKAISASRTAASDANLTQAGVAIGTPAYMAPEQAAADPTLDHRADLYAFGAMAFELLTGEALFAGRSPTAMLVAHLNEAPRDVRALRPDVPDGLADLVARCLAKLPEDRPADAGAVLRALDQAAGSVERSGAHDGATRSTTARSRVRFARAIGTWAIAAVAICATTWIATTTIGLPDWAIAAAVGVALAGLPAVLGTWWIQRAAMHAASRTATPGGTALPMGTMATFALKARPHVTWQRTVRLGAVAATALTLFVGGFLTTRAMGIGPAASLIGDGTFGEREQLVVADFRPPGSDTLLGITVAEALRTDLAQSVNLRVVTRASTREILERMQRPRESVVLFPVAREIATREGVRAVVDGEIVRLGGSYVISARLVSTLDGRELATFRETAEDDASLIPTIGTLSRAIRERVGESLKGIRDTRPLERVTTASLPALRKYVEGTRAQLEEDDPKRALALFEQAVELDSTFAMAWRSISVILTNQGEDRTRVLTALETAMRFRERLSEDERAILEGYYYTRSDSADPTRAIAAYEDLLRRDSLNSTALNNLSVVYTGLRRFEDAERLLELALQSRNPGVNVLRNLIGARILQGDSAGAAAVAAEAESKLANPAAAVRPRALGLWASHNWDALNALIDSALGDGANSGTAGELHFLRSANALYQGRPRTARRAQQVYVADPGQRGSPFVTRHATLTSQASWLTLLEGRDDSALTVLTAAASSEILQDVAPTERQWNIILDVAAIGQHPAIAQRAYDGLQRDGSRPYVMLREWAPPREAAALALAEGRLDDAIASFRTAIATRASADLAEAFLLALAHDRAGRADSAMTWYRYAAQTTGYGEEEALFRPAAMRRLAALHDARDETAEAIRWYESVLELWQDPDPELQETVRAMRQRVAELRQRRAPG